MLLLIDIPDAAYQAIQDTKDLLPTSNEATLENVLINAVEHAKVIPADHVNLIDYD